MAHMSTEMMLFDVVEPMLVHPGMSEDEWLEAGELVRAADRDIPWIAGDWVHHGETHYGDGRDLAVKTLTHLAPSTVARYGFVAKRFPLERRFNISFWHHSEVAQLPADRADEILERAVATRLSQKDVRNLAQQEKAILKGRMPELDTDLLKREKQEIQERYWTTFYILVDEAEAHPEKETVEISRDLLIALKAKVPKPATRS